jgi:hypothetical protein
VSLAEAGPNETVLSYNVKAQVGGKIAQLGARLIDSTAKQMADQFFDRFAASLAAAQPQAAEAAPAAPAPAQPAALNLLSLMPKEWLGLPMLFWGGLVVWLFILALMFL